MERTKVSHVWLDTTYLGTNNTIFSKQVYDLTGISKAEKHLLTIMVDNTEKLVPVADHMHIQRYSNQLEWNYRTILFVSFKSK